TVVFVHLLRLARHPDTFALCTSSRCPDDGSWVFVRYPIAASSGNQHSVGCRGTHRICRDCRLGRNADAAPHIEFTDRPYGFAVRLHCETLECSHRRRNRCLAPQADAAPNASGNLGSNHSRTVWSCLSWSDFPSARFGSFKCCFRTSPPQMMV